MIARFCLLSFVSLIVLAAIDGQRRTRQTNEDANRFCSWLKGNKLRNCLSHPLLGLSAREGVEEVLKECRSHFTDRRWNCSGVTIADVFQNERMLKAGNRESSYLQAVSSAGVAHQITRDCSKGTREECGCDNRPQGRGTAPGELSWEWGGCSDDFRYGIQFSKDFMDPSRSSEKSLSYYVRRHNNDAGRRVIISKMDKTCKCHGVSGSCTVKVCWRTMPKMKAIATELRRKYEHAIKVKLNRNKTKLTRLSRGRRGRKSNKRNSNRRPSSSSLVYAEDSPDFCKPDSRYGILGTHGRSCNKTSSGTAGCSQMCCGRGYNTVNRLDDVKCNCQFIWCCHVKCDWCKKEWVQHTCKGDWKTPS